MKNVMLAALKSDLSEILAQNLEYELQAHLFCVENLQELTKWCANPKSLELAILDENTVDIDETLKLFKKMNPGPMIHIYSDQQGKFKGQDIEVFPARDFKIEGVVVNALKTLDPQGEKVRGEVPDYIPFSINYFLNINSFISDIYIKLKKRDVEQYVKRINAHEEIDRDAIAKYEASGLQFFYIPKVYRFHFINQAVDDSINELKQAHVSESAKKNDEHTPQERSILNATHESYHLTADMLTDIGITENTIKITKASVVSMKQTLKSLDTIAPLLERLLKGKLSYAYKRTHLMTMFAIEVLKRVDWFSREQLPQLIEQMVFAGFLHDILLTEEKLLKIHSKLDLYQADVTEQEKKLVLNHANLTSTLIQQYPKAPHYVDTIVKQHHGTTNGVGFSENLNAGLPKLVIILMVSERLVMRMLDFKRGEDKLSQIFKDLEEEYNLPTYKKVTECLKETLLNAARDRAK